MKFFWQKEQADIITPDTVRDRIAEAGGGMVEVSMHASIYGKDRDWSYTVSIRSADKSTGWQREWEIKCVDLEFIQSCALAWLSKQ